MDLLPLFEWCEASWLGQLVRMSTWMFPIIEAVHLLGLSLLGGALLVVDLRLLNVMLRDQPATTLARGLGPWLNRAVALMLSTGFLLFMSEAVKCYHSPAFRVKMATLLIALTFTYFVRRPMALREDATAGWRGRAVAVASIVLWFTVAAAGRWIGLSS
jgi:hypothetical protein